MKLRDNAGLVALSTSDLYSYGSPNISIKKCLDGSVAGTDSECDAIPYEITGTLVLVVTANP